MTEQDRVMVASFALMGILQRIDPTNTNKKHYAALAWQWADAMHDTRPADDEPALPELSTATAADAAPSTPTTDATTTSDR